VLAVLEVPPLGQFVSSHVCAADSASACEASLVPPPAGEPPLQKAVQLYSVVLLVVEVPPPGQFVAIHAVAADSANSSV
jgi:hypothetical protein